MLLKKPVVTSVEEGVREAIQEGLIATRKGIAKVKDEPQGHEQVFAKTYAASHQSTLEDVLQHRRSHAVPSTQAPITGKARNVDTDVEDDVAPYIMFIPPSEDEFDDLDDEFDQEDDTDRYEAKMELNFA